MFFHLISSGKGGGEGVRSSHPIREVPVWGSHEASTSYCCLQNISLVLTGSSIPTKTSPRCHQRVLSFSRLTILDRVLLLSAVGRASCKYCGFDVLLPIYCPAE